MIIKKRTIPFELLLLRSIQARMNQIITLEKGYHGEKMFDQKLEKLSVECLIINDLLLETANTHYLIDSHLVSPPKIHIFEVKNFEGDFLIEDNRMRLISGKEIKNPLIQLSRTESLFRQLLQQLGYNQKVEAHLVFINPEFYLYGASPDLPIIFPSQLGRFMNQLNSQFFKLAGKHHALAEKLMELHVKDHLFHCCQSIVLMDWRRGYCVRGVVN